MLLSFLAAASIAGVAPAEWTHSVPVAYGGAQATAVYVARPKLKMQQIGMSAGPRMSTERCVWTADIDVQRRLQAGGDSAGQRALPAGKTLQGSRHGACTAQRDNIVREIASHAPAIQAHLVEVAERDQREMRSEIETLTPTGR